MARYMMSVTARDVSIIVTLSRETQRDGGKGCRWVVAGGALLRYKLAIVDLDNKCLTKISQYAGNRQRWAGRLGQ